MRILSEEKHIPCKLFKRKFESQMKSEINDTKQHFVSDKQLYSQSNGYNL